MPAIALRDDYDAAAVRVFATRSQDAKQARRLLSIAAAYEGIDRAAAARMGEEQGTLEFPTCRSIGPDTKRP